MASLTIRNVPDQVKQRLREQAAGNGRSLEAEVREFLIERAYQQPTAETGADLFRRIQERFKPFGGIELEPFPDEIFSEPSATRRRRK